MATKNKLTHKQMLFVNCYDGTIKKAAEESGLSYDYCRQMVTKPHIIKAIKDRQNKTISKNGHIASREERQAFWTRVLNDENEAMNNRLKAAELLGKSEADFINRTEVSGNMTMGLKDALDKAEKSTGVIPFDRNKDAA